MKPVAAGASTGTVSCPPGEPRPKLRRPRRLPQPFGARLPRAPGHRKAPSLDGKALRGPAVLQQQRGRPDSAVSKASQIETRTRPAELCRSHRPHESKGAVQTVEAGTKSRQLRKLNARSKGTPYFLSRPQKETEHALSYRRHVSCVSSQNPADPLDLGLQITLHSGQHGSTEAKGVRRGPWASACSQVSVQPVTACVFMLSGVQTTARFTLQRIPLHPGNMLQNQSINLMSNRPTTHAMRASAKGNRHAQTCFR